MSHISTAKEKWLLSGIKEIEVYRNDVVLKRYGPDGGKGGGARNQVTELTRGALARLAFVASNTMVDLSEMVTLTYPAEFPGSGKVVKRHLNHFLTWCRRFAKRIGRPFSYLWFLEFQKRGAPHVHLLTTDICLTTRAGRQLLSYRWYKMVSSGDRKHARAGTRAEKLRSADGARHYVVKYASKPEQKVVPEQFENVGRFWGCSRDIPPAPLGTLRKPEITEQQVRELLAGWKYLDNVREFLPRVLYNAAGVVLYNALD